MKKVCFKASFCIWLLVAILILLCFFCTRMLKASGLGKYSVNWWRRLEVQLISNFLNHLINGNHLSPISGAVSFTIVLLLCTTKIDNDWVLFICSLLCVCIYIFEENHLLISCKMAAKFFYSFKLISCQDSSHLKNYYFAFSTVQSSPKTSLYYLLVKLFIWWS